ncbi:MAG: rod shape-determining protein RodA [Candidatus Margulisbacteria bacterium]|nr:rod shape-determining protein RodA [Candidatus Margulisiibacteriota bacterium]MBU1022583.1 rod shape-determining protein RodA [Candidatus Margulisiibacteriota bacterium]MBU1728869.1 rod shape-determining protein RodA [Candidatus Margulisiibacteriota bacterium]MBU1955500.1 rod shape-determining protein RodA [Candidatus Margulisiibacteriota bacterium]
MINLRMLKNSDFSLWVCTFLLILIGFFMIFSATYSIELKGGSFLKFINKHFISLLIASAFLLFFAYLDYKRLEKLTFILYPLMLMALLFVDLRGSAALGAQRWLAIGPVTFQPSEFSKLIMIITLAAFLKGRIGWVNNFRQVLPVFALVGIPFLLIFMQPDLGTSLVIGAITLGMLLYSRISWELLVVFLTLLLSIILRQFLPVWVIYIILLFMVLSFVRMRWFNFVITMLVNIGSGVAFPFIWELLKDYQKQRILTFLNPGLDPLGAGYHTLQAKIAVGAGMVLGRGFLRGTQTQLQFIPVQHADFIFSVVAEEFGLFGSLLVLGLFLVMLWRIIFIACSVKDPFGQLICAGIASMYLFHIFVNIGMTLGILPIVGIPLPLLSFGGSALVLNLTCIGIVQSIAMRREKLIF